jgi:hypothetical protein
MLPDPLAGILDLGPIFRMVFGVNPNEHNKTPADAPKEISDSRSKQLDPKKHGTPNGDWIN